MRKLLILFLLSVNACLSMSAQNDTLYTESGILSKKGKNLFMNGVELSNEDISILLSNRGYDFIGQWKKSDNCYSVGKTTTLASCAVLGMSGLSLIAGELCLAAGVLGAAASGFSSLLSPGYFLYYLGLGGLIISPISLIGGGICWIIGSNGISNVVKQFNNDRQATLTFGITHSGNYGLALNF